MKNKTKRLLCVVYTLFIFNNYLLKGKYFENCNFKLNTLFDLIDAI